MLILMLFVGIVVAVDEKANTRNITIEELEKQKNELFKQINVAIDESVKSLRQANDTEATLGLEYMRDLKTQVKELNATENSKERKGIDVDSKSDLENRRSFKKSKYFKKISKPKNDLFDFEAILKPEGITETEWKKMIENRQRMQQKLDLWILEREKEKKKRKEYKVEKKRLKMSGKYEKCPRFGYYGKKRMVKTKKSDRPCKFSAGKDCPVPGETDVSTESEEKVTWVTYETKYPCCRKCCKKSYMGCL